MFAKPKVLLITNIPTPYRIPLFNEIQRQLSDSGVTFKVVFGALGYPRRFWKINLEEMIFDYMILNNDKPFFSRGEYALFTYGGLLKKIRSENPTCIITSGFSIATLKIWWLSFIKPIKYIIWSGDIEEYGRENSLLRNRIRKIFVSRAAGYIAYGTRAAKYLKSIGADENKISIAINTVDTKFFSNINLLINKNVKHNILYIGHLSKRKRLNDLFNAIRCLSLKRQDFLLEILGDGDETDNLKGLARALNIEKYIKFEGFVQKHEYPKYISEADCFVFPTGFDIWGLVLVEAMAAGLPCISSANAGATYDLIRDGENGFSEDFSNPVKVAERINWIFDNPEKAMEMGRNAKRTIQNHATLHQSAQGFVEVVNKNIRCNMI